MATKKNASQIPVLVLNTNFEPINITNAQRAIILILKGSAFAEETYDRMLRSGKRTMPMPSVVRLQHYRRIPEYQYTLSRKNILMRDHHTCQYCQRKLPSCELTLDHVTPKAQNGKSTWENLVACCKTCNHKKGNRTPEQANMKLMAKPRPAGAHTNRLMLRMAGKDHECWQKYLWY